MCNGGAVNIKLVGKLFLCQLLLTSCGSEFFGKGHGAFPHKTKSAQPKPRTKNTWLSSCDTNDTNIARMLKQSRCFYQKHHSCKICWYSFLVSQIYYITFVPKNPAKTYILQKQKVRSRSHAQKTHGSIATTQSYIPKPKSIEKQAGIFLKSGYAYWLSTILTLCGNSIISPLFRKIQCKLKFCRLTYYGEALKSFCKPRSLHLGGGGTA